MIRIVNIADVDSDKLFVRNPDDSGVQDIVSGIIKDVRADGDDALMRYAARFDGAAPNALEVSEAEIEEKTLYVNIHNNMAREFFQYLFKSEDLQAIINSVIPLTEVEFS